MGFTDALDSAVDKLNSLIGLGGSNWRDQLQPASFRGIPFELFDSTLSGGHRNAKHEYPNRPIGYMEPMGPTIEEFSISGFVAGDDYFAKRDELIAALRESGPGTLIDPYMGSVNVVCDNWDKAEVMSEGRMAVFTMTFSQAGDPATLVETDSDTGESVLSEALGVLSDASKQLAETIDLVGKPARIVNAAINKVKAEVELAKTRIESAVDGVIDAYTDLVNQFIPESGPNAFSSSNIEAVQGFVGLITSLDSLLALSEPYDSEPLDPAITATAPSEQTGQKNEAAIGLFFRKSYLATAAKAVIAAELPSYDEAAAIRDELVGKLIRCGEHDLAGRVFNYLNNRAATLARLTDVETPRFTSSLELAHRFYGDASRADDITSRNRIEHPGFIIHQTLKVPER